MKGKGILLAGILSAMITATGLILAHNWETFFPKPETPPGPSQAEQINLNNSGPWGSWSAPEYCPEGQYVYGLRQRVEARQGNGDDTAMNAVAFYCRPLPEQ